MSLSINTGVILKSPPVVSIESILLKMAVNRDHKVLMDLVDSRFLHVRYTIDTVNRTGTWKTNGITPVSKQIFVKTTMF